MCIYLSYWIFSACRLKKHAYAELLPSENHAPQGRNVRTNTRNSAFPRALVVLHLFYRMPMFYFKENYNFPRFQRGSKIFSRGVQLFLGGGGPIAYSLLNPVYNLCFSRGVRAPCPHPPSGSVHAIFCCEKVSYVKKLSILTPLPWVFLNVYMVSGKTTIVVWPGSKLFLNFLMGAQWLSGRVLDSRPKGHGFEPHCVVVLEQDTFILA